MATIVLIHGGWSGKWCYQHNVGAIEAAGNKVICLDLPGHGDNNRELITSVNLKCYVDYIEKELSKIEGSVILVAHSMTGMVIAQVAEDMPDKVEKLVYAAAFMPSTDGQRMIEFIEGDIWTGVGKNSLIELPDGTVTMNPLYARNLGFRFSDDEKFMECLKCMQNENTTMWSEPVHLTEKYHNVPKYYIHTLKDNCLSYWMQRKMVHEEPVIKQYYLDTDHCCMISMPEEFCDAIIDVANDRYLADALAFLNSK